jgi:hypothetical protein
MHQDDRLPVSAYSVPPTAQHRKRQHIQRAQQEFERSLQVLGYLFHEGSKPMNAR